jgi:hypothetical protein
MPGFGSKAHSIFRISALLGVCVLAAVETSSASGVGGTQVTYTFTGTCGDCTGTGVGQLTLQGYTLGNSLNCAYFVGFTYISNLVTPPMNITQCSSLSGILGPTLPGTANIRLVDNTNKGLISYLAGNWQVGSIPVPLDVGSSHTWTAPMATAPAPSTAVLGALGLMLACGGALLARRRARGASGA